MDTLLTIDTQTHKQALTKMSRLLHHFLLQQQRSSPTIPMPFSNWKHLMARKPLSVGLLVVLVLLPSSSSFQQHRQNPPPCCSYRHHHQNIIQLYPTTMSKGNPIHQNRQLSSSFSARRTTFNTRVSRLLCHNKKSPTTDHAKQQQQQQQQQPKQQQQLKQEDSPSMRFQPPTMMIIMASSLLMLATTLLAPQASSAAATTSVLTSSNLPTRITTTFFPDIRYFIAGGACAAASHGIATPVDVIKTRIQAQPDLFANTNLFEAANIMLQQNKRQKQNQLPLLLQGLGPTIIGYGLEGAAKFGLYESLKPIFNQQITTFFNNHSTNANNSAAISYLLASIIAGAIASLMLCPMERTRIRLVTDPNFADKGLFRGLSQLIQEEGFFYIFQGIPAMLSKQIPYTITKQVSFDVFAKVLYSTAILIPTQISFLAALLASVLSCFASQPGDVILTSTYKVTGSTDETTPSFGRVVMDIFQTQGLNGFLSGITARLLHVGCIITSQLILYDVFKQLLGLPATGS